MTRIDPHSYFDSDQPQIRHVHLKLDVDFDKHVLHGDVTLQFGSGSSGPLDLDTKALTIHSVQVPGKGDVPFSVAPEEEILGSRLHIELPDGSQEVNVTYDTSPEAIGLQWLSPEQTEGKKHPFLFSQCQAIHARTMIPLQDSACVRFTYDAEVTIPQALHAVMSAGPGGERSSSRPGTKTLVFEMPQRIPSYLFALAVGNLASRDLSHRSRVWTEPESVDAAAWEFAEIEPIIQKAEGLFGPYDWDRYDMLVLPPSFPYGGMENPRMTFLTPTIIAGDRSLVDVVAHELAHSWTGNLVTNATADHFWLNEGFTVWAERRILEALHGEEATIIAWAIGQKALDESIARFGPGSPLSKLRNDLRGVDPDDAFSSIPYEKGSRFASLIEKTVGRPTFDKFIRDYMNKFRFTSITSEQFIEFLDEKLPGTSEKVMANKWLYETGMPENAPVFQSKTLESLTSLAKAWPEGKRPTAEQIEKWSPMEMLVYLQNLPRQLDRASCQWLDANMKLTGRGNYEILCEWLAIAAGSDYEPAFARLREVLARVGRMKYLRPLYTALGRHPRTRALAKDIYAAVKTQYHALSRRVIEGVFEKYEA